MPGEFGPIRVRLARDRSTYVIHVDTALECFVRAIGILHAPGADIICLTIRCVIRGS
jgi:hypothetical protein